MWYFSEEERELKAVCRDFANKELAPDAAKHDKDETFNLKAFKKMGALGVLGITADPEYGGAGMGALGAAIVMEEFGRVCASSALSYLAHTILCVNNLQNSASKEQKERFLPKLISGEHIGCMGMSEPEYGSDAVGMRTKAKLQGSEYQIDGTKMWITNAAYSDIAYVYTRTGDERKNLTAFIVEKNTPGFSVGEPIHKMGMKASPTAELIFEKAKVPVFNRLGEEGSAVSHMMKNLEIERITCAGISVGIAQACLEHSVKYANERKQFGKTLGSFQLIQKMIAEMDTEVDMMRNFLYSAAKQYDQARMDNVATHTGSSLAAKVKLAIPKMTTKIALDAIQLHGGYGYAQEFPLERFMRDAKLAEIGAGTNEVMITIIAKELLKNR